MSWPLAELTAISRLHVLAAGLPGAVVEDRTFDRPFDEVWGWLGDLERSVPTFDRSVASLEVLERDGGHFVAKARAPRAMGSLPTTFEIDLEPGWCWMVARSGLYVVGMAAEPDGDRTRYAHLEAVNLRAPRRLRPVVEPLLRAARRTRRRHVAHDLDGIEAALRRSR